jgi:hypothetical protein
MGVGYLGGILFAYYGGRWIIGVFAGRFTFAALSRNLLGLFGAAGGLLALLPAVFLGTVVGSLGGAYGEVIFQAAGVGMVGVPIGLALSIAVVIGLVACGGVLLGIAIGVLFNVARSAT